MSGYRQSNFDPNAHEQPGRPLRPFNWVQWTGVAVGVIGIGLLLLDLAGRFGLVAPAFDGSPPFFAFVLIGMLLINSRREPSSLVGSEQLARNRRTLLITVAVCAAVLGAALVIQFSGA